MQSTQMTSRSPASGSLKTVADVENAIQSFARQNAKLERMLAKIGTAADNAEFRDLMNTEQTTSTASARQLVTALKQLNPPASKSLLNSFEKEYRRFNTLITQSESKQKTILLSQSHRQGASHLEEAISNNNNNNFQQKQIAEEDIDIQFVPYTVNELERRHAEIKALESDILEIAEMYRDLQKLVDQQQTDLDSMEKAIDKTHEKAETAVKELEAAEDYQRRARKKACCTLTVVLIVVAVVVLIVLGAKKDL